MKEWCEYDAFSSCSISGLRLLDETGAIVVDEVWDLTSGGDWLTQVIPAGKEIVGL